MAKAENLQSNNPAAAKAPYDIPTVKSAMEVYPKDATTVTIIEVTEPAETRLPEPKYHNAESMSSATRLKRRILETDELVVCPGVYDGFSARIALSVGFTALYMVLFPRFSLPTFKR